MTQIIILAAGKGTRMNAGDIPKPLVKLGGRSLLERLIDSVKKSNVCDSPIIVIGAHGEKIRECVDEVCVVQEPQLGTGHAVSVTKEEILKSNAENVMVLYGDHPFISSKTIKALEKTHLESGKALTMMTLQLKDFQDWRGMFKSFGRIVRDDHGSIQKIVERKDASEEQMKITEVNPALFCMKSDWLWEHIDAIENNNAQGEYYLTDLVEIAMKEDDIADMVLERPKECIGVNSPEELNIAESFLEE